MPWMIANVVHAGHVAVGFFFTLSGFILAYTYLPAVGAPPFDERRFFVARFARIYPVYLFAIALELPRFIEVVAQELGTLASRAAEGGYILGATILMVQAWVPSMAYRLNGPSWSVSAEVFFYAIFPLLLRVASRKRVYRNSLATCMALWTMSLAIIVLLTKVTVEAARRPLFSAEGWSSVLVYTPVLRLPEFAVGVVLGVAFVRGGHKRLEASTRARFIAPISLVALFLALIFSSWLPNFPLHTSLLLPLFGAVIVGTAVARGALPRLLGHPAVVRLGEASYAMYILHVPLHAWLRGLDFVAGEHIYTSWLWVPVYFTVVIAMSWAVLVRIEEPMRDRIRTFFGARRQGQLLVQSERVEPVV